MFREEPELIVLYCHSLGSYSIKKQGCKSFSDTEANSEQLSLTFYEMKKMCKEPNTEKYDKERVRRDLQRRPRSRKYREIVLISGERVKRTDIGWSEENKNED